MPDDQLSLAIGREGQNARLAARLTGWRIDIRSETEFADRRGRARLRRGGDRRALRRDPSPPAAAARTPRCRGSRYCGLPAHQALSRFSGSSVYFILGFDEGEIAQLSDPDLSQEDVADLVARGEEAYAAAAAEAAAAAGGARGRGRSAAEAGEDADAAPDDAAEAVTDDVDAGAGAEEQPA